MDRIEAEINISDNNFTDINQIINHIKNNFKEIIEKENTYTIINIIGDYYVKTKDSTTKRHRNGIYHLKAVEVSYINENEIYYSLKGTKTNLEKIEIETFSTLLSTDVELIK